MDKKRARIRIGDLLDVCEEVAAEAVRMAEDVAKIRGV